jgi:hypothetical protein
MTAQTILIIRHAEKPEPDGDAGVDANGKPDDHSLTPRGWQRAGGWAEFFDPSLGRTPVLTPPAQIFASARDKHAAAASGNGSKSRRPEETVTPLAGKLGLHLDLGFTKGEETELAAALATQPGVTLVCWQHEDILAIVNAMKPGVTGILPPSWPGTTFNVIFRLQRPDAASDWAFDQAVPVMLEGDGDAPI